MLEKFNPRVSFAAIKQHVTAVRNARITLRTGAEIYTALIHEPLNRGQTQYAPIYDQQSILYKEYDNLFTPFVSEVADFANFVSSLNNSVYPTKLAENVTYTLRTGVLGCRCTESQLHQLMQSTLEDSCNFAKQTNNNDTATYIYQFLQYAYEIAPFYAWARYNKHYATDITDIKVNDYTFPRDGRLYRYCFAVLPSTERAFAIADYFEKHLWRNPVELDTNEGKFFNI